eukprot:CAMPEP_0206141340 /NCGR_PEP_ID=MMETSP1473-20131121/12585_1 /ASSEMBLY_ACC=CAM_ASM_001109 /TAXON_ID=1461547 /ORGANISM="Stichococcus sp, Strain RCC1054" /LENGTH=48 /DNA_ID= /DNA_START= /DNA_END= /DNA_ORIENTATION=
MTCRGMHQALPYTAADIAATTADPAARLAAALSSIVWHNVFEAWAREL